MNKIQNAFLQMTSTVKVTCDLHNSVWSSFLSFATPYASFLSQFPAVNAAIALQDKTSTGTTYAKNEIRTNLTNSVYQLSIALVQYGKDKNNKQLSEDAYMSKSNLDNFGELTLLGHAVKIQGLVETPIPAPLQAVPFNIDNTFMTNLDSLIADFGNAIGSPRHILAERVRGTEDLDAAILQLRKNLEDMDSAADVLQFTQPAFYSEYLTSRTIVDAGSSPRSLTVTVLSDTTSMPIVGAVAKFVPDQPEKTSGDHGIFYVQNMDNVEYKMTVTKAGYDPNTIVFEMDDTGVELIVRMIG